MTRIAWIAGLLALAACAGTPAPNSAAETGGTLGLRCPKPGTFASFGRSELRIVYDGADPADPLICLGKYPNGVAFRQVANYLVPPPGQERRVRDGMAALRSGDSAQFGYVQGYRNDPTLTGNFFETWTVQGHETLQIGGQPIQTVRVLREVENTQPYGSFGMRWLLWYAPDSGVWVRGDPTLIRGEARLQPFLVTKVTVP